MRRVRFKHPLAHEAIRLAIKLSYALVAEQLGLTREQVAGFCWRHQMSGRRRSPRGHHGGGPFWMKTVKQRRRGGWRKPKPEPAPAGWQHDLACRFVHGGPCIAKTPAGCHCRKRSPGSDMPGKPGQAVILDAGQGAARRVREARWQA